MPAVAEGRRREMVSQALEPSAGLGSRVRRPALSKALRCLFASMTCGSPGPTRAPQSPVASQDDPDLAQHPSPDHRIGVGTLYGR